MASSGAWRYVGAALMLACATMARAQGPGSDGCEASQDIKIQDARLVMVPDEKARQLRFTLSGRAVIPDIGKVRNKPAEALCRAAIGYAILVNQRHLCELLDGAGGGFSRQDKIRQDDDAVTFELASSMAYHERGLRVDLPQGKAICADQLVVEARPGADSHFTRVSRIPRFLGPDRAEFLLRTGARAEPFDVILGIEPDAQAGSPGSRPMFEPKSWNEPIAGVHLQLILKALLLSLVIALLLTWFERSHPFRAAFGPVSIWLRAPLCLAMAFYAAAALMECADQAAPLVPRASFMPIVEALHLPANAYARVPVETVLLAESVLVGLVVWGAAWLVGRLGPRFARVIEFPLRAMLVASVIGTMACLFAGALWLWGEPLQSVGFEAPALVVSLAYTLIAVFALKKLFGLSWSWVGGIAFIVAITAFYPSDPVFSSSVSQVRIGDNTAVWARLLCKPAANFLYVAALAGFAFRIAQATALDQGLATRWLIFVLILQIASFSISDPTNALAVIGVVLIAPHWLLAPAPDPGQVPAAPHNPAKPRPTIDWERPKHAFPFAVGGVAAFIFLMQFIFDAGGNAAHHRFALLGLANVPRTFAIGYCAGLVLAQAGPLLRGDSATLKAANISLLIFLTNIASALVFLQGRERLVGALASSLGVIAALILSAMIVYDVERAKAHDGRLQWRDLFKGTTLAQGIPIISAVAAALFSALSPIFIHDIGETFGALLKIALPETASGG